MDFTLFRLINGLAGQWKAADEFFRFFANDYVVPTAVIALLVMGWFTGQERWRRVVLHALLALLVANGIIKLSNLIWFRPRPFTFNEVNLLFYYPSDSSFPSNSAAVVWCIAWAIWQGQRGEAARGRGGEQPPPQSWGGLRGGGRGGEGTFGKKLSLGSCFLAALMGFSRVWVGVHYPFDIVGGAAVGIFAITLVERYHIELRPLRKFLVWFAQKLGLA
jgi:undecaprenyl-diphosphatase